MIQKGQKVYQSNHPENVAILPQPDNDLEALPPPLLRHVSELVAILPQPDNDLEGSSYRTQRCRSAVVAILPQPDNDLEGMENLQTEIVEVVAILPQPDNDLEVERHPLGTHRPCLSQSCLSRTMIQKG